MHSMRQADHVLVLDVDGVLINSVYHSGSRQGRWDQCIEQDLGIPSDFLQPFFERVFPDVLIGKKKLDLELKEFLLGTNFEEKESEIIRYWFEHDAQISAPILEIVRMVREKKHKVYIATNQEPLRADYIWDVLDFKSRFDDMFFSGALGVTKSDTSFFKKVNQLANFSGGHRIDFFDDTMICVETAKQAGWNSYLYKNEDDFIEKIKKLYNV